MEPRTATPVARLKTIEDLASAGIPTGVMVAPIIPALNDAEIPQILQSARVFGWLLVAGSIVLFVFSARQGDCQDAERICLMPLDDDESSSPASDTDTHSSLSPHHLSPESHD